MINLDPTKHPPNFGSKHGSAQCPTFPNARRFFFEVYFLYGSIVFVSFVEQNEKIERDVKAVNHCDEMANEAVMTENEGKMTDTIQDKLSAIVVDKDFENSPSKVHKNDEVPQEHRRQGQAYYSKTTSTSKVLVS